MLTVLEYCTGVCGGKCCKGGGIVCGYLDDECKCSIYEKRFAPHMPDTITIGAVKRNGKLVTYNCTRIQRLIDAGTLDKAVEAQCCIAHPELLLEDR